MPVGHAASFGHALLFCCSVAWLLFDIIVEFVGSCNRAINVFVLILLHRGKQEQ